MSVVFEKPTCQFWSNGCQFSVTPLGSMRVGRQSRRNRREGGGGEPTNIRAYSIWSSSELLADESRDLSQVEKKVILVPLLIFRPSYGHDKANFTYWTREPSLACGLWKNTLFFLSVSLWLDFSNFVVKRLFSSSAKIWFRYFYFYPPKC